MSKAELEKLVLELQEHLSTMPGVQMVFYESAGALHGTLEVALHPYSESAAQQVREAVRARAPHAHIGVKVHAGRVELY